RRHSSRLSRPGLHSSRLSRPGLVLFATTSASGGQFSSDSSSRIGDFEAVCRIELEAIIAEKLDAAYLSDWRQQLAEKMLLRCATRRIECHQLTKSQSEQECVSCG